MYQIDDKDRVRKLSGVPRPDVGAPLPVVLASEGNLDLVYRVDDPDSKTDQATDAKVGSRHGKPVVLRVLSGAMHREGGTFFRSANGIWLADQVPARYLELP